MNGIDLFVGLIKTLAGAGLAYIVGRFWNLNLVLPAFFVGFFGIVPVLGVFFGIYYRWRPIRPVCRKGVCRQDDYLGLSYSPEGNIWQCRCGDRYYATRRQPDGTQRFEFMNEEQREPYMSRDSKGRWRRDV